VITARAVRTAAWSRRICENVGALAVLMRNGVVTG
jgi:hypothetical protein